MRNRQIYTSKDGVDTGVHTETEKYRYAKMYRERKREREADRLTDRENEKNLQRGSKRKIDKGRQTY